MLPRLMATLWTLPDGTRCDLIAIVPSGWNILVRSEWQVEVVRGADRLRSESFADVDAAYGAAKQWRLKVEGLPPETVAQSA
jgi:hypothetical protein